MAVNDNVAGRPLDDLLDNSFGEGVYGLAFDKAAEYLRDVLMKMSAHVGWKDTARPFDFDGFSGFYPEIYENRANICKGDYVVGTFRPLPDGRLSFQSFGDTFSQYPEDVNPWYPLADIMDGKLCLDRDNLEAAVRETHHGQEVVYGLRYGEDTAVICRQDDVKLRSALVEREPSLRFVEADRFYSAIERWLRRDAVPGFEEGPRPEIVRYAWNGQSLRSEKEVSIAQNRQSGSWGNDWDLIGRLREEGEKIRCELERKAGITDGRHFKFQHALYPTLGMRDDALFLSSSCGKALGDFITVAGGDISLYREYDPDNALSEPVKRFSSTGEALDSVRRVVLGEKNVSLAVSDYNDYLKKQTQEVSQARQVPDEGKGVKIRK